MLAKLLTVDMEMASSITVSAVKENNEETRRWSLSSIPMLINMLGEISKCMGNAADSVAGFASSFASCKCILACVNAIIIRMSEVKTSCKLNPYSVILLQKGLAATCLAPMPPHLPSILQVGLHNEPRGNARIHTSPLHARCFPV